MHCMCSIAESAEMETEEGSDAKRTEEGCGDAEVPMTVTTTENPSPVATTSETAVNEPEISRSAKMRKTAKAVLKAFSQPT